MRGGNSTTGNTSGRVQQDSTFSRSELPSGHSPSRKNQSRLRSTDSQWMKENQNYSRSMDLSGNYRPVSFSESSKEDKSRWVRDESGFTDGPSRSRDTEQSSLHESMLRSTGNPTSTWDTQSSYDKDSLAKNLFPSDRTRASTLQVSKLIFSYYTRPFKLIITKRK